MAPPLPRRPASSKPKKHQRRTPREARLRIKRVEREKFAGTPTQVRVGERHVLVLEIVTPVGSGTAKIEVLASSRCLTIPAVKVGVFTCLGWLQKFDAMVTITKHLGSRDVILDEVRDARRERSRVRRKRVSCSRGTTRRVGRVRCINTKRGTTTDIGRVNTGRAASWRRRRRSRRGRCVVGVGRCGRSVSVGANVGTRRGDGVSKDIRRICGMQAHRDGVGNGMLSGRILWRQRWEHVAVERNRVVRGDATFVQHRIVHSKIIRELEIRINRFAGKCAT